MSLWQHKTVWLSYVSYPITTAAYIERALRNICNVVTIGPRLPEEYITRWKLENMRLPIVQHDVDTGFDLSMSQIIQENPALHVPDLFLWVESTRGFFPSDIAVLPCPKACYLIDSHISLDRHLELAPHFDYVFIAQRNYLEQFREVNPNSYWLPLACDPDLYWKETLPKRYEIGFVGGVKQSSRREQLLQQLAGVLPVHLERCFWRDMARLFSESKIVFNEAVHHDLNMRFFEVLASGALLLSDMARGSGQDELFVAGEDYALYHDATVQNTARFYLENDRIRERIVARGKQLVHNAHTYRHRVEDLLQVVWGGKLDTYSACELRQQSLVGVDDPDIAWRAKALPASTPQRSFVIPVLDYSPASEFNILTLLEDLAQVPGQVIVVFNSEQVASELRTHPRIDHHVVMSCNIGVSRAWNVGIEISEAPTVFVLNADLHVEQSAIDLMEHMLWRLEGAACVGPQGSFLNFDLAADHQYFDKGSFLEPIEVDAVSGFLFCVKRDLFADGTLRFESAYSPCYFEEWDLGLQIRQAGYRSYLVPTSAYAHHWSGTIRALRTIPYLGRNETAGEILSRNRDLFQLKWRGIVARSAMPDLLQSRWKAYALPRLHAMVHTSSDPEAAALADALAAAYPYDPDVAGVCRLLGLLRVKQRTQYHKVECND